MKKLIFFILIIIVLACGGNNTRQSKSEPDIHRPGQDVRVGEVRWKITGVQDEGQTLASDNQFVEDKTTSGKFIRVTFEIENLGTETKTFNDPPLLDSRRREFKKASDTLQFIPDDQQCILERLNPNIIKSCQVIYEVPEDASGLRANVGDLNLFGSKEAMIALN